MLHFVWHLCREGDCGDLEALTWWGMPLVALEGDLEFGIWKAGWRGWRDGCKLQYPNKELWDLTEPCVGEDSERHYLNPARCSLPSGVEIWIHAGVTPEAVSSPFFWDFLDRVSQIRLFWIPSPQTYRCWPSVCPTKCKTRVWGGLPC